MGINLLFLAAAVVMLLACPPWHLVAFEDALPWWLALVAFAWAIGSAFTVAMPAWRRRGQPS